MLPKTAKDTKDSQSRLDFFLMHAQLSMVASYIDMISVIFIKGKLLKLHAPMSIHAMSISAVMGHSWLLAGVVMGCSQLLAG